MPTKKKATKKKTPVKKKQASKSSVLEQDIVVERKPDLSSRLFELKSISSDYPPKILSLKSRWYKLQRFINTFEGLVPLAVAKQCSDSMYTHLGIVRHKKQWVIVGHVIPYASIDTDDLITATELSIDNMFMCIELIPELINKIDVHLCRRHAVIDKTIANFDHQMSELGIDLSDYLVEEDS